MKRAWKEALAEGIARQYGCYEYYEESPDIFVDEGVWQGWKMVPRAFCIGTFVTSSCPISSVEEARKEALEIIKSMGLPACDTGCCYSHIDPKYKLQTEFDPRYMV